MYKLRQPIHEAERCLGCYEAPCITGCPAGINIPRFISQIRSGNLNGAYQTLVLPNPLPAICSLVCPTDNLCEARCVLKKSGEPPVRIAELQHYVCEQAQAAEGFTKTKEDTIAVLGGGPAGIACAVGLQRMGYCVDLVDAHEHLGGLLSYSIPDYRLPDEAVRQEIQRLGQSGIVFHLKQSIDLSRLQEILAEYPAVFLGIGLSEGKKLSIQGYELNGTWPALDYLAAVRRSKRGEGEPPYLAGHVIVIGGGNVALDSACVAAEGGAAKVTVIYRRMQEDMPGWASEYQHACELGVEFRWQTDVSAITGQMGKVTGVSIYQTQRTAEKDSSGRFRVVRMPESDEMLPCNAVLAAVGQSISFTELDRVGIYASKDGTILVDRETYQTSWSGVFAGGDVIRGGSYVVQAVADGMKAAHSIHQYLIGKGER